VLVLAVLSRQEARELHRVVTDQQSLTDLDYRDHDPAETAEEDRGR
jgi:hypothetical protein